jgi:preprotein translocase subunit SecE
MNKTWTRIVIVVVAAAAVAFWVFSTGSAPGTADG